MALISVSLASARHQLTLRDHGYRASAWRGVSVCSSAFAGTHRAYQRRDGHADDLGGSLYTDIIYPPADG